MTVDVLMFGDSLTEWGPWTRLFPQLTIANHGRAGQTTADMVERLAQTISPRPGKVLVMAGINDLLQGYGVEVAAAHYRLFLSAWRVQQLPVYVQSTLYVGSSLVALNPQVKQLNLRLAAICREMGASYIDLNTVLCPNGVLPDELTRDHLHLKTAGYELWGQQLAPLLS